MRLNSDNKRYHASYWDWLVQTTQDFKSMAEDVFTVVFSEECLVFLLFFLILLTFPISLPVIALSRKLLIKRSLEKQYGKEAFTKGDHE